MELVALLFRFCIYAFPFVEVEGTRRKRVVTSCDLGAIPEARDGSIYLIDHVVIGNSPCGAFLCL